MAVFRVERNRGYTVMSNHHLRNRGLTLKAKGLLSQMLSLPDNWDYTLAGLSHINREKIDAIREAVRELEKAGYIVRSRERDEKGRLRGADYIIYEQPQPPVSDLPTLENPTLDNPTLEKPMLENPTLENPTLENPTLENPTLENPTQLNKDISRTDLSKKEESNTDISNTHSIPILSPYPSPFTEDAAEPERKGTEAKTQSAVEIYRDIIKDNIEYDILTQDPHMDKDRLLIVQDQVWNRVTINRAEKKSTRYYMDEFHLLLKEEQTAAYSVEIWKRFRKWGGIPTAITQNVKDLLSSREVENIFENSDFVLMLNQAQGDREILARQLNISPQQMKYVTHTEAGEGLIFYGNVVLPFLDRFPQNTELYRVMTTRPEEVGGT